MTIEELEIIVTAKVEEAIREVMKLAPAIKKVVQEAQENFSKVDTKLMQNKFQQAVQFMKKKIEDLKKSTQKNEISMKVNNKEAQKQISQIQKQIESLQEKINARKINLNVITPRLDEIMKKTTKEVTPNGVNADNPAIQQTINNSLAKNKEYNSLIAQEEKMTQEIAMYNQQLNEAKSKMLQLEKETNQTAITQNKLSSFFSSFKGKLEQAKGSVGSFKNAFQQMPKLTQNITSNIKKIGSGIKQGLGHVLKYAGALFSLRGIYSVLSNSASTWLSSQNAGAKQLSANIDYMKYAMGSAFAPVIQWVTNLVYQLMKAIQSVVYALFKVNIFANASAKSYSSMAGNAKQTANNTKKAKEESKELAGIHDEINNIQNDKTTDSGDTGGNSIGSEIAPSFDLSGLDSQMSGIAQKIYDFFKPLKDSWDMYGQNVVEAFKSAFNGVGSAVSAMWESVESIFTNGTIYSIIDNILNSIGKIGNAWANAWRNDNNGTEIVQGIANIINDLTNAILNLVSSTGFQSFLNGILSAFSGIIQFLEPVISGFIEMSEVIIEIVMSTIGDLLTLIGNTLQSIGQNETAVNILKAIGGAIAIVVAAILAWNVAQLVLNGLVGLFAVLTSPITLIILGVVAAITAIILIIQNWGTILEWLGNIWNAIVDFVVGIVTGWIEFQKAKFEFIKNIVVTIFNAIKDFIVNIWNGIVSTISNVWNTIVTKVKEGVSGAWNAITSVFGGIANWFGNIFKGAWEAVKNVFSAGGRIFDGIKEGILNGLKIVVNAIIGGINKVIAIPFNGINTALKAIKSVNIMGLQPFSWINTIGVPQIPKLAKGGVLTEATTVIAGEYSGASTNPEIVTPQNIMEETFDKVMSRYQGNNDERPINLAVYVSNKKIGQILLEDLREMKRQTGNGLEALVGG